MFDKSKIKKTITLTLTQSCNLDCLYCYENHKSNKYMPFELAKSIMDSEMKKLQKTDEVEIDLFGGEPFVKFEKLKQIVEYAQKQYKDYNLIVFVTTNGTLLTDEIKTWVKTHSDILKLGLSYDGTPEMQDYNRSNSSQMIDLDFFASVYPEQDVKMTVSQHSLNTFADGVIFLHEKGLNVACNLAYGIDWSDNANKAILERELKKLIEYYLNHPEIKPCSMLDDPISQIAYAEKQALRTCGAGWAMVAYDVDGRKYPCQLFMPLSIGEEKASHVKEIKFPDEIVSDEVLDSKCIDCILKSSCQRCYGSNYIATGNIYMQDKNMCELTKIIYKARAYFKAMLYENHRYDECNQDEIKMLLKSILLINEKL